MSIKKLLVALISLCITSPFALGQTTLSEGDLVISYMTSQGGNDFVGFVPLVDLDAGTVVYFTNTDAINNNFVIPNSGLGNCILSYTTPSGGVAKGTYLLFENDSTPAEWTVIRGFFNAGTGGWRLSDGDNLVAYQGTDAYNVTEYLFEVTGTAASPNTFPAGFTSIVAFGAGNEDGDYNGPRNDIASNLFSAVLNTANWTYSAGGINPPNSTDFNVGYYWDGSWTPSNPGGVGSTFDDDIIVDGISATFSGNVTTNGKIFVKPGGTMDVGANAVTADSLIIEADATGQGQVKGAVTGDVEFQSYITSASARWFNVGLPVNGALSNITFTNGGVLRTDADGPTANANIYFYDPNTLDGGTSEGTWTVVADQTPAADANGWSLYLGGGGAFGTLPMTISAFGNLNNGNVDATISTANGGWNFVNNPYAGSIDLDEVDNDNTNLNNNYYIRDDENDAWVSYDAFNGTPTGNRYISAGQAFFVQTSTPTTLAFQEDQIALSQTPALSRGSSMELALLKVWTSDSKSDHTVVTLKSGASDSKNDILDGVKRMNDGSSVPNLYTSLQGFNYVSKYIDDQFSSKAIPLHLVHDVDDELTIAAEALTINNGIDVTLEDKLSGDMIDLRQQNYTSRHVAGNDPDRFVLHLSQSSVGIDETANANEIFAYLDGDVVNVNLESLADETTLQLFDMGGKMLINEEFAGGQIAELNLPNGSQGVYLLKVLSNGQLIHSQKIMK